MRLTPPTSTFFSLPTSLLLLISAWPSTRAEAGAETRPEAQWPYNLAPGTKYFPEDEVLVKRGLEAQKRLAAQQSPVGMKKMSDDPAEMFFLDYWVFDEASSASSRESVEKRSLPNFANASIGDNGILPALLLHSSTPQKEPQSPLANLLRRSSGLARRDYDCPVGTHNCANVGNQNRCCGTNEACISVTDTGNGDVGCCPSGATCGDTIGSCDTGSGYQSCPGINNGGCCMPGFDCFNVGCKWPFSTHQCSIGGARLTK
jgi:hypothetical protein